MSLWEQLPDETPKAYHAFTYYRDMEPQKRSYAAVAKILEKHQSQIDAWGSKYQWKARASACDHYHAQLRLNEIQKKKKETLERAAKVSIQLQCIGLEGMKKKAEREDISAGEARRIFVDGQNLELKILDLQEKEAEKGLESVTRVEPRMQQENERAANNLLNIISDLNTAAESSNSI